MPVRMATIPQSENYNCWQGREETETFVHCWQDCKMVQPQWKTVWRCLTILKIDLPCDPATSTFGYICERIESRVWKRLSAHLCSWQHCSQ